MNNTRSSIHEFASPKKAVVVRLTRTLFLIICLGVPFQGTFAVPAFERPFEVIQPSGEVFQAVNRGDEWYNWNETVNGYTVAPDHKNYWYYVEGYDTKGTPILSSTRADEAPVQAFVQHLRPPFIEEPKYVPGAGLGKGVSVLPGGRFSGPVLFILVEFDNQTGSTTEADWASFVGTGIADS